MRWRRRKTERADGQAAGRAAGRRRFERVMFSFMGPPQVGDVSEPVTVVPDHAQLHCRRCGRPWDDHEVVRTVSMTYARCPGRA